MGDATEFEERSHRLLGQVESLCDKARSEGLSDYERAQLDVGVKAFAWLVTDHYAKGPLSLGPGAVVASRLGAEKGADLEAQSAPFESGFDIVTTLGRFDLLACMQALLAGKDPVARRPHEWAQRLLDEARTEVDHPKADEGLAVLRRYLANNVNEGEHDDFGRPVLRFHFVDPGASDELLAAIAALLARAGWRQASPTLGAARPFMFERQIPTHG